MAYEDVLIREATGDGNPPDQDDLCPVCGKLQCECPPDEPIEVTVP